MGGPGLDVRVSPPQVLCHHSDGPQFWQNAAIFLAIFINLLVTLFYGGVQGSAGDAQVSPVLPTLLDIHKHSFTGVAIVVLGWPLLFCSLAVCLSVIFLQIPLMAHRQRVVCWEGTCMYVLGREAC